MSLEKKEAEMDIAYLLTTETVKSLNGAAIEDGRNRTLSDEFVDSLAPFGFHMVTFNFIHNDREMRLVILCAVADDTAQGYHLAEVMLDTSFELFDSVVVQHQVAY